jgi:3-phosphoshikimate 1-carboxyvinyltransferase
MSQYIVQQSALMGSIAVPPSKSHSLRAILFASLSKGKSMIHGYLNSPDIEAMITACRLFGAKIEVFREKLEIEGVDGQITKTEDVIHAGNSGIVLRFCSCVGALAPFPVVITGDESIRHQRPMQALLDGLAQLGVRAVSMRGDGYAPIIIEGPLKPGKAVISGEDSQVVSALLIAGAFAEGPVELEVHNAGEKPWVALTLDWLDRLKIDYERRDFDWFRLKGNSRCARFEYHVPGDLSSAAFPIAAALITGSELILNNVDMQDIQGDKELIGVFQQMGAVIEIDEGVLRVKKGAGLTGVAVDINNFVDGMPILAVVACFAEGETHIYNGAVAREKECDRIKCIANELKKMGADITETEDGLRIRRSQLNGASVHSHKDHRMAMSLAVAGLGAKGETSISSFQCVSKTFPSFVEDFQALGAKLL